MSELIHIAANIATVTGCVVWGDALTIALVMVGSWLCGKRLSLTLTDKPSESHDSSAQGQTQGHKGVW